MESIRTALIALLAAMSAPTAAQAQSAKTDDVVVMRRAVAPPRVDDAPSKRAGTWREGPWAWDAGAANCTTKARRTRSVQCEANGAAVRDEQCRDAKPPVAEEVDRDEGCTWSWSEGAWSDAGACKSASSGTRDVHCRRSDGKRDADDACLRISPKQATTREGPVHEGCARVWVEGNYGAYLPNCAAAAYRSRTVQCQTLVPGSANVVTTNDMCDPATRPANQQGPVDTYSTCPGTWAMTTFADAGSCVGGKRTQTSTPYCKASNGTTDATAASCNPNAKPAQQTRQVDCVSACGALEGNGKGMGQQQSSTHVQVTSGLTGSLAEKLAAAQTWCTAQTSTNAALPNKYFCHLNADTGVALVYFTNALPARYTLSSSGYGSTCQ